MTLRIFRVEGGAAAKTMDLALDPHTHRTGDVWHIEVTNLKRLHAIAYAWLASGEAGWRGATRFAPGSPLLDPYAKLVLPVRLPASEQGGRTVLAAALAPPQQLAFRAAGAARRRPRRSAEELAILEVDPFTFAREGSVAKGHEGKWLGVLDRLEHILATGVTAVALPSPMLRGPGLGVQVSVPSLTPPSKVPDFVRSCRVNVLQGTSKMVSMNCTNGPWCAGPGSALFLCVRPRLRGWREPRGGGAGAQAAGRWLARRWPRGPCTSALRYQYVIQRHYTEPCHVWNSA
jgi:hypothetical protein